MLTSKAQRQKFIGTGTDENPQFGEINNPTNATFKITDAKLYLPVITLSTKENNNFLEQLKFKRTIKWNKYRSEMTNQTKTSHLNNLIDPTFTKVNRLFVLLFENEENRTSFSKYYVPKFEIKDFHLFPFIGLWILLKTLQLMAIDLSKQIELENPDLRQQIDFIGKLEDDKATMFFIIAKSEETTFEFLQNSVSII